MTIRYILSLVTMSVCLLSSAQTEKWHNPQQVGYPVVHGQAFQGEEREGFYHRFPARTRENVRKAVWNLSKNTAGESICFSTDSKNIKVRYRVLRRKAMNHMPATGVSGVDLYTYDKDGKEIWLAPKYAFKDTVTYTYSRIEPLNVSGGFKKYTLFLPVYNEVEWLEIGVDDGSKFRFEPLSSEKPIVAYGTSICQGACASRPAMAWTNILQRRLGRTVVNLGFSGNCMHEREVIDLVADVDAAVYILDGMPNLYRLPAPELQDTIVKAVRQLRDRRPDTPIILVDHSGYPNAVVNMKSRDDQERSLKCMEAAYKQLVKEGVKGLYRLRHEEIGMKGEMFVEGIHMSDYGMKTYADAYEPLLRQILKIRRRPSAGN